MKPKPHYTTNVSKALEVILWVAERLDVPDVYRIVKVIYYGDLHHIANYGRPITGEDYKADAFGPLARVAYGILRGHPIELIALDHNGPLPFEIDGRHRVVPTRAANENCLSESDTEALSHGIEAVRGKTFNQICRETHDHAAYVDADGGRMDYRLFIPKSDPEWEAKAEYIRDSATNAVI